MKRPILIALLALSILCNIGFAFQGAGQSVKYEYKVLYYGTISEKKVNELADQGWELVATAAPGSGVDSNVVTFIFKREKR